LEAKPFARQMSTHTVTDLKRTALHSLHLELDARLVPFAGYEMPVQYKGGIRQEHTHTRNRASLFDISHMGQLKVYAENVAERMESLVPGGITSLGINQQCYSVLTNDEGGIIDDLMISRGRDHLFMGINAACKETDIAYLRSKMEPDCRIEILEDFSLLALQGPEAAAVMADYISDIDQFGFMQARMVRIDGVECLVHRCGYTGEDGFEISVQADAALPLARTLLAHDAVEAAGLGARDSLRLEAGLCLYGHDINAKTTPVEANLGWVVAKKYRGELLHEASFPGAATILGQLRDGPTIMRTGIRPEGRTPVREEAEIQNREGRIIGRITSGGYGQTTGGPVAMGYVESDYVAPDTPLNVIIRGRPHPVRVTPLPFVKHRYHTIKKKGEEMHE